MKSKRPICNDWASGKKLYIVLDNFRCFSGEEHRIPLKPLTILLGENSSGKSSFLGALSTITDLPSFPLSPNFNIPPFALGAYQTIASKRKDDKNVLSFSIGFEKVSTSKGYCKVLATYKEKNGRVEFKNFTVNCDVGQLRVYQKEKRIKMEGYIREEDSRKSIFNYKVSEVLPQGRPPDMRYLLSSSIMELMFGKEKGIFKNFDDTQKSIEKAEKELKKSKHIMDKIKLLCERMTIVLNRPILVAPIRSKPQRTYDTLDEQFVPEGKHIPLKLAHLYESPRRKNIKELESALSRFGRESGLFQRVKINQLHSKTGLAFQVLVAIGNQEMNLIDVGYGVSQILPVVVESVLTPQHTMVLLQQPEVHLHPKAQAALGSLFLRLVSQPCKCLLVETHSFYLLDRIRREVAESNFNPELIQILYFESKGLGSKVYPLSLDKWGNIKGAPPSYGSFFLNEEVRLLSRAKSGK